MVTSGRKCVLFRFRPGAGGGRYGVTRGRWCPRGESPLGPAGRRPPAGRVTRAFGCPRRALPGLLTKLARGPSAGPRLQGRLPLSTWGLGRGAAELGPTQAPRFEGFPGKREAPARRWGRRAAIVAAASCVGTSAVTAAWGTRRVHWKICVHAG